MQVLAPAPVLFVLIRCINIDWLEVYALEPIESRRDADYFRACGWQVEEREYGTPMYHEMFTLIDHEGYSVLEIRRNPKSTKNDGGLFDLNGCHIRLVNRTCYADGCARMLADFLFMHNIMFVRISRIDLCLDFKRFDSGDYPAQFIRRYLEGKFSKINQARVTAHGEDTWGERKFNSISWGARKSDIRTRLYDKTMELKEVKDKPYIRQAWFYSKLVDDPVTLFSHNPDGSTYSPRIWRLEFQISSSVKRWFVMHPDGDENVYQSIKNTLDVYETREQLLSVFDSIQQHYFHFKYYDSHKRKDRCKDKVLFNFNNDTFYRIDKDKVSSDKSVDFNDRALLKRLELFRAQQCANVDLVRAATLIIDSIHDLESRYTTAKPFSRERLTALRLAISNRMKEKGINPVSLEQRIHDVMKANQLEMFLEK